MVCKGDHQEGVCDETNKKIGSVGCGKDDDVAQRLHAVHLGEHLAQHAGHAALAGGVASVSDKTVDLVLLSQQQPPVMKGSKQSGRELE